MKTIALLITLLSLVHYGFGQTVSELYSSRKFKQLVQLDVDTDELSAEECYMMGYAFYSLGNDAKAIEQYDKAMNKGMDDANIHFYKGLSLRYSKQYDEALVEIEIALKKDPKNQEYGNEKGLIYYYQGDSENALHFFEEAKTFPNTYGEPFFWVARIHHEREAFEKALNAYYEVLEKLDQKNSYYYVTLSTIGQLEFTFTKNYNKAVAAYSKALDLKPKDYKLYPQLIKAFNAGKQYKKADSVFVELKNAYDQNLLAENEMKFKNASIDEYLWNDQKMVVYRYFEDPKEVLDVSYKVYLINKEGKRIERTFMVEKSAELPNGAKHLLCEQDQVNGRHITYPYGWNSDAIPLDDLKRVVGLVLDGKMEMGASSSK